MQGGPRAGSHQCPHVHQRTTYQRTRYMYQNNAFEDILKSMLIFDNNYDNKRSNVRIQTNTIIGKHHNISKQLVRINFVYVHGKGLVKCCNWACKLTDGCSLKSCVRPHLQKHHLAYTTEKKVNSTACSASVTGYGALNKCVVVYLHLYIRHQTGIKFPRPLHHRDHE